MIAYSNSRYDKIGLVNTVSQTLTVEKAMHMLIDGEFTFGAHIHAIGCTCVNLVTHICGNKDEIIFDGPEEDMELLIEAARLYKMFDPTSTQYIDSTLNEFAFGCTKAEAVTRAMIRSKCKDARVKFTGELKDLISVMLLIRRDNIAPDEAFSLLN